MESKGMLDCKRKSHDKKLYCVLWKIASRNDMHKNTNTKSFEWRMKSE